MSSPIHEFITNQPEQPTPEQAREILAYAPLPFGLEPFDEVIIYTAQLSRLVAIARTLPQQSTSDA